MKDGPDTKVEETYLETYAGNRGISLANAVGDIESRVLKSQMDQLLKGKIIYVNSAGGWDFGEKDYSDWYESDNLVFPHFTKAQIRISQYGGGEHYYAHIGRLEVKDGDTIKWDTREEAYQHALAIIGSSE